jgi:hypothetical protein
MVMWILSFLPNWAIHLILLAGVLGLISEFFLGLIPLIKIYRLEIRIFSLLILSMGLYLEGGLADNKEWQARVKEMELKVAAAEVKSAEANTKIITKIVKKTKTIHDKGDAIVSYIDREVVKNNEVIKFVENCPIPTIIINTHNAAALNTPIGEKK